MSEGLLVAQRSWAGTSSSYAQTGYLSVKASSSSVYAQWGFPSLYVFIKSSWLQYDCTHVVSIYWFLCKEPKHYSNNQLSSLALCLLQHPLEKWKRHWDLLPGTDSVWESCWYWWTKLDSPHFSIAHWQTGSILVRIKFMAGLLLAEITGLKELWKEQIKRIHLWKCLLACLYACVKHELHLIHLWWLQPWEPAELYYLNSSTIQQYTTIYSNSPVVGTKPWRFLSCPPARRHLQSSMTVSIIGR